MQPIVSRAIKALNVDVPILKWEVKGDTVTLWLYGHYEPVTWSPPPPPSEPEPTPKASRSKDEPKKVRTKKRPTKKPAT